MNFCFPIVLCVGLTDKKILGAELPNMTRNFGYAV